VRDSLGRSITYLRLSVTDRCNLRCVYCMPTEGVELVSHEDILTVEETVELVSILVEEVGIGKVRITGGEPLVRKGVIEIAGGLADLDIDELALTTNGILLGSMARDLARSGVQRVNVSLDSLRNSRLRRISRMDIGRKLIEEGIAAAQENGMAPVKVNCVVMRGWNDDEIVDFIRWGSSVGAEVRFIEHMPSMLPDDVFVSREEILERASALGRIAPAESGRSSTADIYRIEGTETRFGVIAPFSGDMCSECCRIRLSARGILHTCLASDAGTELRDVLRGGGNRYELHGIVREAILGKPRSHGGCVRASMWKIGG